MACERCIDIHKAQNVGITSDPCPCKCHKDSHSINLSADSAITLLDMTEKDYTTKKVEIQSDGSFK